MKFANKIPALILALGLALALGGFAEAGHGKDGVCAEDRERLCPDAKRGNAKACLTANQDQLSQTCADRIERKQQRREAFQADCGEDAAALCSDVEPGKRAVKKCLMANLDQLSATCNARFAMKMEKRAAFEAACGADLTKFCGDAEGKHGGMRCLFEQKDGLTDTCQVKLDEIQSRHQR